MTGLHRERGQPANPGAIHRCVLAGFPSQIGRKSEEREYLAPRGVRFLLSPGSSLFRQDAPWVVAVELVETTRLYARGVGRVRADWVERVAPHLVVREVFEPHWLPESGQVAAWERVSLHGLVLVPRRRVPFGPIDARAARDIFIQSALVDETIRTDGAFLAHNRELIEELERVEAKKRVRDVLVDLRARFDFYDARVPPEIHSTPSFEKWRRHVERSTPRLLFMSREILLRPGAADLAPENYPDMLSVDGLRMPLDYRHEPGHLEDGVTLTVPLAAVEQVPAQRIEWLVPGMLVEKVVALLRTLPKRQRVRFVPATEYAEGAAEAMPFGEGSLTARLAEHLHRLTGTPVAPADFRLDELPAHLRMNVHVLDEAGEVVARGRDLAALRRELAGRARASLARATMVPSEPQPGAAPAPPVLSGPLTTFPAAPLPGEVAVRQGGMLVRTFAALEDRGDSVALRLLGREDAAALVHAAGVRRLLALALRDEVRPMLDYLPHATAPGAGQASRPAGGGTGLPANSIGIDALALLHAPYGSRETLERDLELRIAERAATLGGVDPAALRDAAAFGAAVAAARPRLWDAGCQAMQLLSRILQARLELDRILDAPLPSTWEAAVEDVRRQTDALLPPRFLAVTPWEWLVHVPRYLRAALIRLQKLRDGGHRRDAEQMGLLRPFLDRLEARLASQPADAPEPELARIQWLVEELRVSLFAQDLRTAVPVSTTRLEREWSRLEA